MCALLSSGQFIRFAGLVSVKSGEWPSCIVFVFVGIVLCSMNTFIAIIL
jgi:hypothetical protein